MPNVDDLRHSRFLKQRDVRQPVLVTISRYEQIDMAKEGDEPDFRWALYFEELEKPLLLIPTNGETIRAIIGSNPKAEDEFAEWIGHKIVLYMEPSVLMGGRVVGGVRVRAPKGQAKPTLPTPFNRTKLSPTTQEVLDTPVEEDDEQPPF